MSKSTATATMFLYLLASGLLHLVAPMPTSVRPCRLQSCQREEKLVNYGFDAVKQSVQIDVGTCSEVYEDSNDCDIPDTNRVDNSQEGSGDADTEQCQKRCEPRSYERISSSNRESPFTVNVVKSCYRTRHHCLKECIRKPSYVYVFPGSKYQQRIDVGKCVGQCGDNLNSTDIQCVASRQRSIAVEGPNGYESMQIIEECACKNTLCYRVDHYQSFSELMTEQSNNTTSQKKRRERLINIGKCVGSCPGVKIPGTCYPSDDNCIFYLGERNAYCVPTVGEKHTYTDLDGNEQSVAAVVECGCSTA